MTPPFTLVRGGRALLGEAPTLARSDILIAGDTIAEVGAGLAAPAEATVIDAADHIVIPGLVNCHTHAHNNLLKGISDDWTLEDARNYGRALFAGRTSDDHYVSAAIGAVEMLRSGCTAAYDMFTSLPAMNEEGVEAVFRAYADVGLRAVLAPQTNDVVFYQAVPGLLDLLPEELRREVESLAPAPTEAMLKVIEGAIRRFDGFAEGRIRVAAGPVVPGECSDSFLAGCVRIARDYGVGVHTHLAESKVQAVYGRRRWGKSTVRHLADIGLVGPRFVGAHGVWLDGDEMALLGAAGAAVSHNPKSNLKLGSGLAPVRELLDAGVAVGLGSDGSMASDNQNMFETMRVAALASTVRFPGAPSRWLDARAVFHMATVAAARVLGLADQVGRIAPGYKADLVLLRADSPYLNPLNDAVRQLVFCETGAGVDKVLVGGRLVVDGGRVSTVDEAALRARAEAAAERLRVKTAEGRALSDRLLPFVRAACGRCLAEPFPVDRFAGKVGQ